MQHVHFTPKSAQIPFQNTLILFPVVFSFLLRILYPLVSPLPLPYLSSALSNGKLEHITIFYRSISLTLDIYIFINQAAFVHANISIMCSVSCHVSYTYQSKVRHRYLQCNDLVYTRILCGTCCLFFHLDIFHILRPSCCSCSNEAHNLSKEMKRITGNISE